MQRKTAMISSTVLDLPAHRQGVRDACIAADVFPKMMECLPARDKDAIATSTRMVDEADIFIAIYAWRYGHVPKDHDVSITEMELDRAVQREVTILPFLMDPTHAVTADMVEADKSARARLDALKERACAGRGRVQFRNADELRGQVEGALKTLTIQALANEVLKAWRYINELKRVKEKSDRKLKDREKELSKLQTKLEALESRATKSGGSRRTAA